MRAAVAPQPDPTRPAPLADRYRALRRRVSVDSARGVLRWVRLSRKYPQLRRRRFYCGPASRIQLARDAVVTIGPGFVALRGFTAWFGSHVSIGAGVFFNEGCHVMSLESLTIGDGCLFGEQVSIHDEDHVFGAEYRDQPLADRGQRTAPVVIGNEVWVGAKATIVSGVTIGDGAVVAAHAVVTRDVPPHSLVAGVPARLVRSW